MTIVFLGAGFSSVANIPLASQLFEVKPDVDRVTRMKLVDRITSLWNDWHNRSKGSPEEFLAYLEKNGGLEWKEAVRYVALSITMPLSTLQYVSSGGLTVTKHNITRATNNEIHENFWSNIFKKTKDITVITTNYDILAERGLRNEPKPRKNRPGFNYGEGNEQLNGGGYPSFTHIRPINISGSIPLLKLHGSISWAIEQDKIIHYIDCRPAISGNVAILAPITEKKPPIFLQPIWEKAGNALADASKWIIVGYSLPQYDLAVRKLFSDNGKHNPEIHVFDISKNAASSFKEMLPNSSVEWHDGLPNGIPDIDLIL
jgi:hypothetical protein